MRHFIYLDNDALLSYYAQAFDGIDEHATFGSTASVEEIHQSETIEHAVATEGKLGVPAVAEAKHASTLRRHLPGAIHKESNLSQEIAERRLHDNAVERLLLHLVGAGMIQDIDSAKIGEFVTLDQLLPLQNYGFLARIAGPEFKELIRFGMASKTEKMIKDASATTKANDLTRLRSRLDKEEKAELDSTFSMLNSVLDGLKAAFPFDAFYFGENFIVPTIEKHFKEPISHVVYKYSEHVKLFGRVTRIGFDPNVRNTGKGELSTLMSAFSDLFAEAFKLLGFQSMDGVVIVSPVAVYLE